MKSPAAKNCIQWGKPIRITKCSNRGKDIFVVSWYDEHGRRQRIRRASEQSAKEEADAIAERLKRGQPVEVTLTQADRLTLERAKEVLRPHGLSLDHAVMTLTAALKHTDIHSLVEAARWFQLNRPASSIPKTGKEVLDEMLLVKATRSPHTVADLRRKLTRFAKAFQCPLATVGTAEIEKYISGVKGSARTKLNALRTIGTLFNFAKRKRFVPHSHPGISEVERIIVDPTEVQVFTPGELKSLLREAPPELVPMLAIAAFAGVRTEECKRLDWSDVLLDRSAIQIRAPKAKTKVRRVAKISANLRLWLKPYVKTEGPICVYKNPVNELLKLAKRCGVEWKKNALRHSFVSYRVALTENVASVSLEAGNSDRMIHRHYLKFVSVADARRWFGLTPAVVRKSRKEEGAVQGIEKLRAVYANGSTKPCDGKTSHLQPQLKRAARNAQKIRHLALASPRSRTEAVGDKDRVEVIPVDQHGAGNAVEIDSTVSDPRSHGRILSTDSHCELARQRKR
jgi:integrase